jgi:tetratricopeptide (TPR) repeat protein
MDLNTSTPDLLEVLELEEWYDNLSSMEQEKLNQYSTAFGTGGEYNLLNVSMKETTRTAQSYLRAVGSSAANANDYEFAEKVLLKALDVDDNNPTDRHFVYNQLIDLYYKQRGSRQDAIDRCVSFCKKDIDSIDVFLDAWMEEYDDGPPRIPSFERLAMIYERQGEYACVIDICDMAIKLGLESRTVGFSDRKNRIKEKMGN